MPKPYTVDSGLLARGKIYQAVLESEECFDSPRLSVTTLCALSGVPRSTFYRHFSGIDDFIFSFLDDTITDTIASTSPHLSFYQAILIQCTKLADKKTHFSRIIQLAGKPLITRIAQERMREHLTKLVLQTAPDMLDEELLFEIEALSLSLPPLIIKWATTGFSSSPVMFASMALSVIPERLLGIVGNTFVKAD